MILFRSVIFLALVGTGVWYFLAEPDRKAEIAAIEQELGIEAELRQSSLTQTIQKFELAAKLIARSEPVAAIAEDKPQQETPTPIGPDSLDGTGLAWPVAPPITVPGESAEEQYLEELASLKALTTFVSVRILKDGDTETRPVKNPPPALLTNGMWDAGTTSAFQGSLVRVPFQDELGNAFVTFFTPYISGTEVPAIVIADALLEGEQSIWGSSDYRLILTGMDGNVILSNNKIPSGAVIEISRDIPALNAVFSVATAQPEPVGPWAIRSGGVVLIALLLLFLWEMNLSRRRLRAQMLEARLLSDTPPDEVLIEKSSGTGHNRERLSSGESLALLGQVSESIGQEINRPLSAIRSHVDATLGALDKGDVGLARENIRLVSNLADRISRIIANMRGFMPSQPYQIEPVSIRPVVHDAAVKTLEHDPALGDFFFMEVGDDVDEKSFVRADKTRLSQVIDSMLSSSWDACREQEEPELVISIHQTRSNMVVAIDYSGDGDQMADHDQHHLSIGAFAEASGPVGKGVSFTIAKSIVEGMGGRLIYKASALGGGRIEIVLPKFKTNPA